MNLKEFLLKEDVWIEGLCWPSYSQLPGSFSELDDKFNSKPLKLFVHEQYGRFGNNIYQALHALIVARRLSIKTIYFNFYLDDNKTRSLIIDDMMLIFGVSAVPEAPQLSATLFYPQGFEKIIHAPSGDSIKWDAERLSRMLLNEQSSRSYDCDRKVIVFHFRSGDIFEPYANPIYVQPPLSYYVKALEHIVSTVGSPDIYIVYENDRNPCIEVFKNYMLGRGISYKDHSSSFREDATLITTADCLVSSYSSFCDVLALMNENLGRWYSFRSVSAYERIELSISKRFSEILLGNGTEIYLVKDDKNLYTSIGEWAFSNEKIDMMLNYPIENLSLSRIPNLKSVSLTV